MKPRVTHLDKVLKKLPADSCIEWPGYLDKDGYGKAHVRDLSMPGRRQRHVSAHRLVYETLVGPIAEGLHLDHLCRNKACVNPAHMEPVTPRVNHLRTLSAIRGHNAFETCVNGHPWTPESTYIWPNGYRTCRACNRAATIKYYLTHRAPNRVSA